MQRITRSLEPNKNCVSFNRHHDLQKSGDVVRKNCIRIDVDFVFLRGIRNPYVQYISPSCFMRPRFSSPQSIHCPMHQCRKPFLLCLFLQKSSEIEKRFSEHPINCIGRKKTKPPPNKTPKNHFISKHAKMEMLSRHHACRPSAHP